MKLNRIYSTLQHDLDKIERELELTIETDVEILKDASLQLLQAGGKRIRPVFVLLASKFGNFDLEVIKKVATSLELIHMASLVHDDVIDDAELRRGKPTIKSQYDNKIAMYTGDYILARSLDVITEIKNIDAHRVLSYTMVEVVKGEIEQVKDKFNWDQNIRTYFRRIKRKTALLIAASCQLGAIASNVCEELQKRLYLFGYYVGMAFQITDDILDFTATEKQLGKPAGSDLTQGNITLPVLYAIRDPKIKERLACMQEDEVATNMASIIKMIKASGGIEYANEISARYLEKAFSQLEKLPNNSARTAYFHIAKFIGRRNF